MATEDSLNHMNGTSPSPLTNFELDVDREEFDENEAKKKAREPPVVYKDLIDIKKNYDMLIDLLSGKLNGEEQQSMKELDLYMLQDEGSWSLGDNFLNFLGRLLHDKSLSNEIRICTMNILAAAALKDDLILLLHQDRKEHIIMNYGYDFDKLSYDEQKSLALFFCNMFENINSSEWLFYISEWKFCNQDISNIRITTKIAVHATLSENRDLQEYGTALMYNMSCKEVKTVVFDDVAVEITMALLQFLSTKPTEEHLFRSLKSLCKLVDISRQEVPQLIDMIGPKPDEFGGQSERLDAIIDQISSKLH